MRRLGEVLLENGAIAVGELHTALEAVHRLGGRLGTQLLRLGFVDERALLEALSQQNGVPFVPESVIARTSKQVREVVPLEAQRRLLAVPFEHLHGRLAVAMVNPRDQAAIEEIAETTGSAVEPHVAVEIGILRQLDVGHREQEDRAEARAETAPGSVPDPALWDRLWGPRWVSPGELRGLLPTRRQGDARSLLSTFPELVPIIESGREGRETLALDMAGLSRRLLEVRERDQVGELLLRFASGLLARACLLGVHSRQVTGWLAHGDGVVLDDLQTLVIPLDEPSVFLGLLEGGAHYLGPLPPGGASGALAMVLGDPTPDEVVVVPIRVQERVVAFLLGDNPGQRLGGLPTPELVAAAGRAGIALEILILRNKIRS